jgi:bifunctional ADP-heptose synthase (sugar kinase/adenylyltransferase)
MWTTSSEPLLNSDYSVRNAKPGRPVIRCIWRARQLAALEVVDYVVIFDEDTPRELIKKLKPRIVVCGDEWLGRNDDLVEVVANNFGQVVFLPPSEDHISTTAIIERLQQKTPQE